MENMLKKEFKTELEREYFDNLADEIVEAFKPFTRNQEIKTIWIDIGAAIYDIHIEIITDDDNSDFYFSIDEKNNTLVDAISKDGNLKNAISPLLVDKLIDTIKQVKKEI